MAIPVPTYSDLITYFPGAESTDAGRQSQIDLYLQIAYDSAGGVIGQGLVPTENLETQIVMLLAMHLLKRTDRGDNLGSGGVGGMARQSLDAVVQSYGTVSMNDGYGDLRSTVYGARLARLLLSTMNVGPVLL